MKKISTFLGLIGIAILAINVQSCKDDDNENKDTFYLGSWRETSNIVMCDITNFDSSDSSQIIYTKFTPDYEYIASYEGNGKWSLIQEKYTYKDGQISYNNEDWLSISMYGSELSIAGEAWEASFKKEELPAIVETMISNGEYIKR